VVNIEWISGGKDAAKHQERKTATRLHENNGYFVYPPPNTPRSGSSNQ
jgi:hypothetical protein